VEVLEEISLDGYLARPYLSLKNINEVVVSNVQRKICYIDSAIKTISS
jgi:hypothetical protein